MRSIGTYYTDMQPSNGIGKNAGRRTAIGASVNRKIIVSFPARLNGGRIPDIRELSAILRGDSIMQSKGWRELVSAKVLARAKFSAEHDFMNALDNVGVSARDYCLVPRWNYVDLSSAAYSTSKEVHAIEDAVWEMRMDAEREHGTYSAYVARFLAAFIVVAHGALSVVAAVERMNTECLDWVAHPSSDEFILVAFNDGVYLLAADLDGHENVNLAQRVARMGDSWMQAAIESARLAARPRVSLAKPDAEQRAVSVADVPQESNAVVMARAVSLVRSRRLAAEDAITADYVAAHAGDSIASAVLASAPRDVVRAMALAAHDCEMSRALEAEQQRADAAAYLAGREKA